jgi:hypothetical protein
MTEQTVRSNHEATSVRKVVAVQAPPAVAWRVFTEKMGAWWPLDTHKMARPKPSTR